MKKITRIQKSKIIEKVKTIVLVLLFLSCAFLGYQIFETYHEQTTIDSLWNTANQAGNSQTSGNISEEGTFRFFENFSKPLIILANGTKSKTQIKNDSKDFESLTNAAGTAISNIYDLSLEKFSEAKFDEWENALKAESVYFRYAAKRSFWYESTFYKKTNTGIGAFQDGYDELLISLRDESTITVFLRDRFSGKIIKANMGFADKKLAAEVLKKYDGTEKKEYVFAHELNLDKETPDKVILDSMLALSKNEPKVNEIVADIPRLYKIGLNFTKTTEFTTSLLKTFGYNPNTVRQYANSEDALIFVGETGSLSIYPEGRIEYKALDSSEGISLAAGGKSNISEISSGIFNLIENIIVISGVDTKNSDFDIKFTKMPQNVVSGGSLDVCFDYFVDGKKVVFDSGPAICATVEDGALVEFRMQVRDIEKVTEETTLNNIFAEIDDFSRQNPSTRTITDGSIIYKYNKNGENIKAKWRILGE